MLARLRSDIQCILDRDPAARSTWEVITCYPGLHAIWLHRPAHWCWHHGLKWLGRFISHFARCNAVVIKPVPAGATAVGIPARIIPSKEGQSADVTEPQPSRKFTAYGITQEDDPLSQAMRGLIDNASSQEHQIALLWQAIEKLSAANLQAKDCVPCDAAIKEQFEAGKLNELVGK
eukprot:gene11796-11887_t